MYTCSNCNVNLCITHNRLLPDDNVNYDTFPLKEELSNFRTVYNPNACYFKYDNIFATQSNVNVSHDNHNVSSDTGIKQNHPGKTKSCIKTQPEMHPCGNCFKKVRPNDCFITCNNCELYFHKSCVDDMTTDTWWCRACFTRTCLNELPYGDTYIDLDCFLDKGLKFAHINIQSLGNKIDHIKLLLQCNNIDLLYVTETWLNDNYSDDDINVNGYNLCRLDREGIMSHGGIICYIKEGISYKIISKFNDDLVEALWVEINLPQTPSILTCGVYRKPDSRAEYLTRLNSLFQEVTNEYDDVVIFGDFNLDISKPCNAKKINSLANHSNLRQLIKDYTRITETTKSKLDLAFVSNVNRIASSGSHSCGLSDHNLIYVVRRNKKPKSPPKLINYRSMKKFNEKDFIESIKSKSWNIVYQYTDVNSALSVWTNLFNDACDSNAPIKDKLVKGAPLPEWINEDFIQLSHQRDHYFKKAHKTNDPDDWKNAKMYRNKVNNMNKYLKKNYCCQAINENVNDSKKLWSTIKKLIPKNKSSIHSVKCDNGNTTSDKETADKFNDFFTSIGTQLASKFKTKTSKSKTNDDTLNNNNINHINKQFDFDYVTPEFVFDEICKMHNSKSPGFGNMNVKLLKLAAPIICHSLAYICNISLQTSVFPKSWKQAKVTPIHKEGDKSDVSNYRPISVLPVVSKIIERAVHNQLYSFLTENNILNPCQSGFRSGHSTTTTLLDVSDCILNNMNQGKITGALFLDLKKAFDTVNHSLLIEKLQSYGISGNQLKWFISYLSDRTQSVNVNSTVSDCKLIDIGIPQGSILGPLLFILYVNSLPDSVDCKCIMYADDTTLLFSASDPLTLQQEMNDNMARIAQWFEINQLTLNIKKTKFMIFGTNHSLKDYNDIDLMYGNDKIERVDKFKYLGVIFDPILSWSEHIDYISSIISKRIGVIRRVKFYLPPHTLKMLANALVFPHFDYCSAVWSNCNLDHSKSLQILQNKLARVLLSADIKTSVNTLMQTLDWNKLHARWVHQLLIIVLKCLQNHAPTYLSSQFNFTSSVHSHNTRSQVSNTLVVPLWNKKPGRRTFLYRGSLLWNMLPSHVRTNCDSFTLPAFKSVLNQCYNVQIVN